MGKRLIIVSERGRKKVAIFSDGRVEKLHVEDEREGLVGSIFCGQITRVLPSIPGAFVDFGGRRDGFLPLDSMPMYEIASRWGKVSVKRHTRDHEVREGQKVLVQVVKEPMEDKGARLTTDVSIPGRYLVYMPIAQRGGISRRIEDEKERDRLHRIVKKLSREVPGAFIIRTVCEGQTERALRNDSIALRRTWRDICKDYVKKDVPRLLHQELALLERVLRDLFTADFELVVVNSKKIRRELGRYIRSFNPDSDFEKKIRFRTGPQINEEYQIDRHLRNALSRKVWLRCGGYLFIDELPTLAVIDVNTGRNVKRGNPQETILETNLEAAREIPRQLRLRDIGGIIIIDFIDMARRKDIHQLLEALKEAMGEDRAAWDVIGYSEIGLVQITRKRDRHSLLYQLTEECPHCNGDGRIPKI